MRVLRGLSPFFGWRELSALVLIGLVLIGVWGFRSEAAAFDSVVEKAMVCFREGDYSGCVRILTEGQTDPADLPEDWFVLKAEAEVASGRYSQARKTVMKGLQAHTASVRIPFAARQVFLRNDEPERAGSMLLRIEQLVRRNPRRYGEPADRLVLAETLLLRGIDAREILEKVYDPLREERPNEVGCFVATGRLALDKGDFALAVEVLRRAVELSPDDPEPWSLLARALLPSDRGQALAALSTALDRNPNHAPSLLLRVDVLLENEDYEEAEEVLVALREVDSGHPLAWAYFAVLHHLAGETEEEAKCRETALVPWSTNPEVDSLIGRELSQKYRFLEGANHQNQALRLDPDYRPAKLQLGQDLLRLGEEAEGWRLTAEVSDEDPYNVIAYNLTTLHETLKDFVTLQSAGFAVRMERSEAAIYGSRVLDLLDRAGSELCAKYGVRFSKPIVVEIFPEQKDFAIRTFGLPGGHGFLGVCFGHVITANSPAARPGDPVNWEAVLWHELCHSVTLAITRNKMPRWLSEGISVYEERQENPSWGQSMTPRYREMILGGDWIPIRDMSRAFLSPETPLHLQFAYFASSLVVEYFVEQFGTEKVRELLRRLGEGEGIEEALVRVAGPLERLEQGVAAYARRLAEDLAPEVDWDPPTLSYRPDGEELETWCKDHPRNFLGLQRWGKWLVDRGEYERAEDVLNRLIRLYPSYSGPDHAYGLLAQVHRERGETSEERAVLETLARLEAASVPTSLRLIELALEAEDWVSVRENSLRLLAVQPLLREPHRSLARAAEALGRTEEAIEAYRSWSVMDPLDPAEIHYRLASLLRESGRRDEARREVVKALELAPRYRRAQGLLLDLVESAPSKLEEDL